jgi:hypothetical protein
MVIGGSSSCNSNSRWGDALRLCSAGWEMPVVPTGMWWLCRLTWGLAARWGRRGWVQGRAAGWLPGCSGPLPR